MSIIYFQIMLPLPLGDRHFDGAKRGAAFKLYVRKFQNGSTRTLRIHKSDVKLAVISNWLRQIMPAKATLITIATKALIPAYHACLDAVARERIYLEMTEAPPLEKVLVFQLDLINKNGPSFMLLRVTKL